MKNYATPKMDVCKLDPSDVLMINGSQNSGKDNEIGYDYIMSQELGVN